jgi:cellobiose phosphorylase
VWVAQALARQGRAEEAWRVARLLNPLNHGTTQALAAHYKVEPYVLAADVYMAAGHAGRGGWTWYTGAAGWMYRLIVESLLGVQRRGARLMFAPCVPDEWTNWSVQYRYRSTLYRIGFVREASGMDVRRVALDGGPQADGMIVLRDDGREHVVEVRVGCAAERMLGRSDFDAFAEPLRNQTI